MTGATESKTNKLKELDNDPFGMGSLNSSSTGEGSNKININLGGEDDKMMSDKDAAARLKELGSRKAISSEDFIDYKKDNE